MKQTLPQWLTVLFLMIGFSPAAWAVEPEAVNVYRRDGTITSTMFHDFQNLELSDDVLIIHQTSGESTTIALDNVANILWGDYTQSLPTAIDDVPETDLQIYHADTYGVIRSTDAILHYAVFDTLGRLLYTASPAADTHEVQFATTAWTSGIYLVYVETTACQTSAKIIL